MQKPRVSTSFDTLKNKYTLYVGRDEALYYTLILLLGIYNRYARFTFSASEKQEKGLESRGAASKTMGA
jgi:hypothetical protein